MSDYISREQAVKQITKVAEQIKTNNSPYILTALYLNNKEDFPSADVRENVHGEWIPKERKTECSVDIDIVCSRCGYVGIEGYAHGYELNELPAQEMKDYIKKFDMNYCTCCGADMRGK